MYEVRVLRSDAAFMVSIHHTYVAGGGVRGERAFYTDVPTDPGWAGLPSSQVLAHVLRAVSGYLESGG